MARALIIAARSAAGRCSPRFLGGGSSRREAPPPPVDVIFPPTSSCAPSAFDATVGGGLVAVEPPSAWRVLNAKSSDAFVSGPRSNVGRTFREHATREGWGSPWPRLVAGCVGHLRNLVREVRRSFTSLARSSLTSTTCALRVEMDHSPRSFVNVDITRARSMSSIAPSGRMPRFVRDESGKFVRSNAGGGGEGGRERGESRVRVSRGSGRRGLGGGGRGGRGGRANSPQLITSSIQKATRPHHILNLVRDNLFDLNHIHVNAVFNRLGKMAGARDFSEHTLASDENFQELLRRTQDFSESGKYGARNVSNITHGIAKLHDADRLSGLDEEVDQVLTVLEIDAVRVAPDMISQDVSNLVWAYATLGRMPGEETWVALEGAALRVAPDMVYQAVSNTLWAYATLGKMPGKKAWEALEAAALRVAPDMRPQALANTLWAYGTLGQLPATLGQMPAGKTWEALEAAALRVTPQMDPQNVSNTLWAYGTLGRLPRDETWAALEAAAVRVAPDMVPQALANTLRAYTTIGRMPGEEVWGSVEAAAVRLATDMDQHDVAGVLWAYAKLGRMPGEETWVALEDAMLRLAPKLFAQNVSNTVWAYATLGKMPGMKTWGTLQGTTIRVAPDMNPQEVANTVWGYATLGRMPINETWIALEAAALRVAPDMVPQNVSNTLWGYATLGRMPGEEAWEALEAAALRVAPDMSAQDVSNTVFACASLGRMPNKKTWAALEAAALRIAPDMNSQNVAMTAWGSATFSILNGIKVPSSFPAIWDLACRMNAESFSDKGLSMLFHTYLMIESLDSRHSVKIPRPEWLMKEAQDVWMRMAKTDVTISKSHRQLAKVFNELDIKHEVERLTDDGYFSMDIYLPEHDVCVEFDGPTHYYSIDDDEDLRDSSSSSSSSPRDVNTSTLRNARTQLRDFFLAKRCAKVVAIPWFEFDKAQKSAEKLRRYVREKLLDAGVDLRGSHDE